jgi:amidase
MNQTTTTLAHTEAGLLAAQVAAKAVSARELALLYLERIESIGRALNAVVVLDADRALVAAGRVDQSVAAGETLGPLAGVPMTVKEAFAVEGLPTTAGLSELAGPLAVADAPAVAALRAAGAVVLGKTNVPVALADLQSENPVYGRTVNPWNAERSCGGSSGGSAAAVAAGLAALELGSDLGGSIRVPAAWCGVYGMRPTIGLISKRGHLPWPLEGLLEPPSSAVGPIARSVADLTLGFGVLARIAAVDGPPPARLRIAVWPSAPGAPVDRETAGVVAAARDALETAGACTEDFVPPFDAEAALALAGRLMDAEITHGLSDEQWQAAGESGPDSPMYQLLRRHLADQERRLQATRAWDAVFDRFDAVLCPAVGAVAQIHDATPRDQRLVRMDGVTHPFTSLGAWSLLGSFAHLPTVTLPAGPGGASGLPVGVQLIGRYRGDMALLGVAGAVDDILGGWRIPPGW